MQDREQNITRVVDYFLDQIGVGDDRPVEVVIALCELKWNRTFVAKEGMDDMVTLEGVEAVGVTAQELLAVTETQSV